MTVMAKRDDDDEKGLKGLLKGVHPSELAIVGVAFVVTCCFIYMALMPQNWDAIDRAMAPVAAPKPPPPQQVKGEVQMQLFDARK